MIDFHRRFICVGGVINHHLWVKKWIQTTRIRWLTDWKYVCVRFTLKWLKMHRTVQQFRKEIKFVCWWRHTHEKVMKCLSFHFHGFIYVRSMFFTSCGRIISHDVNILSTNAFFVCCICSFFHLFTTPSLKRRCFQLVFKRKTMDLLLLNILCLFCTLDDYQKVWQKFLFAATLCGTFYDLFCTLAELSNLFCVELTLKNECQNKCIMFCHDDGARYRTRYKMNGLIQMDENHVQKIKIISNI